MLEVCNRLCNLIVNFFVCLNLGVLKNAQQIMLNSSYWRYTQAITLKQLTSANRVGKDILVNSYLMQSKGKHLK